MELAEQTESERRIFERFSARLPAKFKHSRNEYGTDVFLRDASASGARIVSAERFYMEDNVTIEVKLPGSAEPLTLNGKVVWARPVSNNAMWDIGLEFQQVSFMRLQRIFKFSDSLS
jgi:hypothetical protein